MPYDEHFENRIVKFRRNRQLLVAKNIHFRTPSANFEKACTDIISKPVKFFWQRADKSWAKHPGWAMLAFDTTADLEQAEKELEDFSFHGRKIEIVRASKNARRPQGSTTQAVSATPASPTATAAAAAPKSTTAAATTAASTAPAAATATTVDSPIAERAATVVPASSPVLPAAATTNGPPIADSIDIDDDTGDLAFDLAGSDEDMTEFDITMDFYKEASSADSDSDDDDNE